MEDIKELLKKSVEIIMPDLDHYRRPLRKGRVTTAYPAGGTYVCDVELLLNDDTPDESEPLIKGVELPVIWGGKNRGIICPPAVGTYCDVDYYQGDANYPRISNLRWHGSGSPIAGEDELIIQQKEGVFIHIKNSGDIEIKTSAGLQVNVDGNADITVKGKIELKSEMVNIDGGSGNLSGVVTQKCICPITGAPHIEFSSDVNISK